MRLTLPFMLALVPLALMAESTTLQPASKEAKQEIRTLSLSARGSLKISNDVGRITVTAWDRADVELQANFKPNSDGGQILLKIDGNSDHLEITSVQPKQKGWFNFKSASCGLELKVPRDIAINLSTDVGTITVDGVKGAMDLKSDVGNIKGSNLSGHDKGIRIRTDVGKIALDLQGVKGNLRARTDVGSIHVDTPGAQILKKCRGAVDATLNGGGKNIELSTDVGSIKIN